MPQPSPMWAPDARRGFLAGPSPSHVHAIAAAEELLEALPDLLHRGELAAAVQELPVADLQGAIRPADADLVAERVFRVYAFLAHAYLRAVAESAAHVGPPPLVLPKSLSVPWAWAAARSHRYPSLDYASSVLANCVHVAADAPVQPDLARDVDAAMASRRPCVRALTTFTGTADERHFYEVHARVEIEAAPAIGAMAELLESAGKLAPTSGKLAASTARALTTTAQSVRRMAAHLPTMTRGCRPSFFYSELRPYLGAPGRPVLFDGVGEARGEPPLYVAMRGASGAQSAVLPCVDALLGISHRGGAEPSYLAASECTTPSPSNNLVDPAPLRHMPIPHRQLLCRLESTAPASADKVRAMAEAAPAEAARALLDARAECARAVVDFRKAHMSLVRSFILQPAAALDSALDATRGDRTEIASRSRRHRPVASPPAEIPATADANTEASGAQQPSPPAGRLHGTGGSALLDFLAGRLMDTVRAVRAAYAR